MKLTKAHKLLMVLGALTIIVLIAYIVYKNSKVDNSKILKKGDIGKEVFVFQQTLNDRDYPGKDSKIIVSGYFDGKTEDKLFKFIAKKEASINSLSMAATIRMIRENKPDEAPNTNEKIKTSTF